jgi:hypothetical protein
MKRAFAAILAGALVLVAAVLYLNLRGEGEIRDAMPSTPPTPDSVARGAYLVRAGNCMT